jgi:hypothetical protein
MDVLTLVENRWGSPTACVEPDLDARCALNPCLMVLPP